MSLLNSTLIPLINTSEIFQIFQLNSTTPILIPEVVKNSTSSAKQEIVWISNVTFYSYFTFIPFLSFLFLLWFLYRLQKVRFKLSLQLSIHMYIWMLCTASTFIYTVPILLSLVIPSFVEDNLFMVMVRGSLNMSAVESIQLSTTFLIINRIQAILFPSIQVTKYRHTVQKISIFVFSLSFVSVFIIVFQRGYAPKAESETACVAFACRLLGQLDDLTLYKMLIGLVNIALGSFFVYIYFRYAKKSSIRRENRKNFAVLLILITEFLFTVTPNGLYLSTNNAIIPIVQMRVATMLAVGYSTDALVTTIELLFTVTPNALYLFTNNAIIFFLQMRVATLLALGYSTDALVTAIVYWVTWFKVIAPPKVGPSGVLVLNANNQRPNAGNTSDLSSNKT